MSALALEPPPLAGNLLRLKRLPDDPEVRLMLRVQDDDGQAFAELIERYWPQVFGRFYRRLGDRQLAEDLAQEVFLRLYRHRKRYRPEAKFATWLFHIADNLYRNALRSRRRRPCVRLDTVLHGTRNDAAAKPELLARTDSPSRPMERAELADRIRDSLLSLNGRQRAALELNQFEDRTYAEVAAELEISPEAAKSLLYRARNQLRECLSSLVEG